MSGSERRKYLTSTVLDQSFLDWCHDNLENRLEFSIDITSPTTTIRASNRNKYVGGIFYEALCEIPVITRTVGEWLAPDLQFSTLQLELSNADERFNSILPSGIFYNLWVGESVTVKLGLGEQSSTYKPIFYGKITDIGGMKRSVKSVTLTARDINESLSVTFPQTTLSKTVYANIEDQVNGTVLPVIYGDWTTSLDPDPAIVPAFVVNGADVNVQNAPYNNVQCVICDHSLISLDTTNVYLRRQDVYYQVPSGDVVNVGVGNKSFQIDQNTANLWVNGAAYLFEAGDEFFVRVQGKDLGSYDNNLVAQAKDLLLTYGGLSGGDFHANWDTFRDKSTPSQSAIVNIPSRVWENEPKPLITYVLSMLEQVRLEAFFDKDQKIKLNSLHFEDFNASPSFVIKNWDVTKDTFVPELDERNNFNRAQAVYDFHPNRNENARQSAVFKNSASITQIGKAISKRITFPNLYVESDVTNQLKEIIKMASALFENISLEATWRSMLVDVGDFVKVDVKIGSTQFDNVPCMVRSVGVNPQGMKIPMKLWSMQMMPFPSYTPSYSGTVGGYSATITQE